MSDNIQLDEEQKEEFKRRIESHVETFRKQGETAVADKLEKAEPEDLLDEENFQKLKTLTTSSKKESQLKTLRDNLYRELGVSSTSFNIDKYQDLPKVEIAQEIADHMTTTMNIRPVYKGKEEETIEIYKYDNRSGLWKYYSYPKVFREAKKISKRQFTGHLKRELKQQLMFHKNYMRLRDMGTDSNWIVVDTPEKEDPKKIFLGDLSDLKNLDTETVIREDFALHKINVEYNPEAECPRFKEFVEFMLDGKDKQIKTLQEFMGWLLKYPDRSFKKALLILGVTNSGKSQLAEIIELMFSGNNGKSVMNLSVPMIGAKKSFHLHRLESAILNVDKDLTAQDIERADLLKKVIAQESLEVEPKGQDSFNISPEAKHIVCANVAPQIKLQDDDAFYGRFLTLKAPNSVPREDRVKDLGKKLFEEEGSGILNWMLEGLKRLEEQGEFTLMPEPNETQRMWWEFGDSVHRFLWEMCEITQDLEEDYIPKDDLYDHYEAWIEGNMNVSDKDSRQKFKHKIKENPFITDERRRVGGARQQCFLGIKCDTEKLYDLEDKMKDDRSEEEREVK